MNQKAGFTTGSINKDLDAKFGNDRRALGLWTSTFLWGFAGLQVLAMCIALVSALPAMAWLWAHLSLNPGIISTLLHQIGALFK